MLLYTEDKKERSIAGWLILTEKKMATVVIAAAATVLAAEDPVATTAEPPQKQHKHDYEHRTSFDEQQQFLSLSIFRSP